MAPSTEWRKWFDHVPARRRQFQARNKNELREKKGGLKRLERKSNAHAVTFVYAARDEQQNKALVLKRAIEGRG